MTCLSLLAGSFRSLCTKTTTLKHLPPSIPSITSVRHVSSSPYGRTHVWKNRPRELPKPFVPTFPQLVVRADGSTYTHYTTSPKSEIILTRDTSNNPVWNPTQWLGESDEEDQVTGRLGRFNRKFEGIGGHGEDVDWMSEAAGEGEAEEMKEMMKQALSLKKGGASKDKKQKPRAGRVG